LLSDICVRGWPLTAHPFDCSSGCPITCRSIPLTPLQQQSIYQSARRAFSITIDVLTIVLAPDFEDSFDRFVQRASIRVRFAFHRLHSLITAPEMPTMRRILDVAARDMARHSIKSLSRRPVRRIAKTLWNARPRPLN